SRRRHTISKRDWSSDVCSSDLVPALCPFWCIVALLGRMDFSTLRTTIGGFVNIPKLGCFRRGLLGLASRQTKRQGHQHGSTEAQIGRASCREREGVAEGGRDMT